MSFSAKCQVAFNRLICHPSSEYAVATLRPEAALVASAALNKDSHAIQHLLQLYQLTYGPLKAVYYYYYFFFFVFFMPWYLVPRDLEN